MEIAVLQDFANQALTWIGFGTVIGLITLAALPGQDRGGSMAAVSMTIVGALIGCALLKYFYRDELVQPVSGKGFMVGVAGAVALLIFYRVLGSQWLDQGDQAGFRNRVARRKRQRSWIEES